MRGAVEGLQRLGRALMLPIAVLPVAGLLLRLGQPDLLDLPVLAAAGNAIFSNLGLIFAVGVAVGLARENHGAAGLASLVGFLVATQGAEALLIVPPAVTAGLADTAATLAADTWRTQQLAKLSMPVGILSGLIAGFAYNRYSEITLPSYLAFFGGRRFVPIATGCIGVLVAVAFGWGWPALAQGMDALSHTVSGAGGFGLFAYGVLNRVLIITGLHHILNNFAWFLLGDFHGVTGDLKRFFAGDPAAGAFMSGFFPVMMFGLPGACLAMYRTARPERRRAAGGLLLSIALTSFLTGVTEPIEFTFMFMAPALYALHAVLTGLSMVLMDFLDVKLGFSFSAGLFDYVLNFRLATRPLWLLPIGAGYFALYYALFRYGIVKFNLMTPGREPAGAGEASVTSPAGTRERGGAFVTALGGPGNISTVDACTTRLRLTLASAERVDRDALARLGVRGIVQPSAHAMQVVLGPIADQVAGEIRRHLRAPDPGAAVAVAPRPPLQDLVTALGGRANLRSVAAYSGRLRVGVVEPAAVDVQRLRALGARDAALIGADGVHVLLGDYAQEACDGLQRALR